MQLLNKGRGVELKKRKDDVLVFELKREIKDSFSVTEDLTDTGSDN